MSGSEKNVSLQDIDARAAAGTTLVFAVGTMCAHAACVLGGLSDVIGIVNVITVGTAHTLLTESDLIAKSDIKPLKQLASELGANVKLSQDFAGMLTGLRFRMCGGVVLQVRLVVWKIFNYVAKLYTNGWAFIVFFDGN